MEGKFELQFENNEYYLVDGNSNDTVATTDKVLLKEYDGYMKKLSLKNCQAIEKGYDLDELAENYSIGKSSSDMFKETHKIDFIAGAKTILELFGDKKFSEEDIKRAFIQGVYTKAEIHRKKEEYIQSLQQTEWDVEIVMECVIGCENLIINGENSLCCGNKKPKLDTDGCLILKIK